MSNIFINNYNNIKLRTSKSEYWDFILSKNNDPSELLLGNNLYDTNLISYINMNDDRCYSGDTIYNTTDYKWLNAFNSGLTLSNIGFTGIDNGLIKFDKNNITSIDFFNILTGSTYSTQTGDTRLKLNSVSGNTGTYVYPLEYESGDTLNSIYFNGGFYQGVFKSYDIYQILPSNIEKEIAFDFTLKPDFTTPPQPNTLNEKYVNNKGIFFYMGLRAENKFWYDYEKTTGETFDISSTGNTTPLETGVTVTTNDGFDIETQGIYKIETDNKFILFNRTPYGLGVHTYNPEQKYYLTGETKNSPNLFTFLNRSEVGHTVHDIPSQETELKYSIYNDINRNNIAFRIKDDGSVGYRMLTLDCEGNLIVDEEYSNINILKDDVWASVVVRLVLSEYEKCQTESRTMKLMFYVNSNLILVSKSLPEIFFRELLDRQEKQEGVAYNISLGGGSQGLCDMIGFDEDYETKYLLPIEENFAGSFIGNVNKFRIFYGKHDYSKIKNNYNYEFKPMAMLNYVEPTIEFIVSENSPNSPDSAIYREIGNLESLINATITPNKSIGVPYYPLLTGYKLYYYPNGMNQTQINGMFPIPTTGGTIPEFTHNDPSFLQLSGITYLKYMIEVFDAYKTTVGNRKIKEIIFDNMIFYGDTDVIPSGSTEIRNLPNKAFNTPTNELTLQTGNVNKIFVIAIPASKEIDLILDENAMFADITRTYILNEMLIEDAGGNPTPYNVYVMKNAIPYTRNHKHKITFI